MAVYNHYKRIYHGSLQKGLVLNEISFILFFLPHYHIRRLCANISLVTKKEIHM